MTHAIGGIGIKQDIFCSLVLGCHRRSWHVHRQNQVAHPALPSCTEFKLHSHLNSVQELPTDWVGPTPRNLARTVMNPMVFHTQALCCFLPAVQEASFEWFLGNYLVFVDCYNRELPFTNQYGGNSTWRFLEMGLPPAHPVSIINSNKPSNSLGFQF